MAQTTLTFGFPYALWILAVVIPLSWLLFRWSRRERKSRLEAVVAPRLREELTRSVDHQRRMLKAMVYVYGLLLLLFAAARPQFGYEERKVEKEGVDFLIALDLSRSMLAEDADEQSRLAAAKGAIASFLRGLSGGERVGVIGFAGDAFLAAPLTQDFAAVQRNLEALTTTSINAPGTDISSAIKLAIKVFPASSSRGRALLLISDGEELQGEAVIAARKAGRAGIRIFAVGAGSIAGVRIPEPLKGGPPQFIKNEFGRDVVSRLNPRLLQQISAAGSGLYAPLEDGEGLSNVYQQGLRPLAAGVLVRASRDPKEYFQWPLAWAIILLLCELLLNERRKSKPRPA